MSAYIVDPRTIDYLVAWAQRHRSHHLTPSARVPDGTQGMARADVPECLQGIAGPGERFYLVQVSPNDLGAILLAENVRSVRYRYPNDGPDDLPGPCDQGRVWGYQFRPITNTLDARWVIKACDCLDYQSCETTDWEDTLAHAILTAIREDAIASLTTDAPWGITDDDLNKVAHDDERH
jgi:hypothetical protein